MRNNLQADKRRFDEIQKMGLRNKEKQLIDEVNELKKEKQMLRMRQNNVRPQVPIQTLS